jgi:hypothetical protein
MKFGNKMRYPQLRTIIDFTKQQAERTKKRPVRTILAYSYSADVTTPASNKTIHKPSNHGNFFFPRKSNRIGHQMEERAAIASMNHYQRIVDQLLQSDIHSFRLQPAELRKIFLYWLSKPVREIFRQRKEATVPLSAAFNIIQWSMKQFDNATDLTQKKQMISLIEYILAGHGAHEEVGFAVSQEQAKCYGLCRLMALVMQPLQGTRACLAETGSRNVDNASEHLNALYEATQIHNIMERLHQDNIHFPNLQPDDQSYQTSLNLIGKRCKFLVFLGDAPRLDKARGPRIRRGIDFDDPRTKFALGGCETPVACIKAAKQLIERIELPNAIHYSIIISMYAYTARRRFGMGDEAYSVLEGWKRKLQNGASVYDDITLYNPILMAYSDEATAYKEIGNQDASNVCFLKAMKLWDDLRKHRNPDMSADPITYSIILKMHQLLDMPEEAQKILNSMVFRHPSPETGIRPPSPTIVHYNIVLNAWSKANRADAGERALALLKQLEQSPETAIVPDNISYTTTIDGLLRHAGKDGVIDQIKETLTRFERASDSRQRPDDVTYNVIFHGLSRNLDNSTDPKVKTRIAQEAEQLFWKLRKNSHHFLKVCKNRMYRYYNDCMRIWAKSESVESAKRVWDLLAQMEDDDLASSKPNGSTYENVIDSLGKEATEDAVKSAEEAFARMEKHGISRTHICCTKFFKLVLSCPFKGPRDEVDKKVVDIIMKRLAINQDPSHKLDSFSYKTVFLCMFDFVKNTIDPYIKERTARRLEKLFFTLLEESDHFRVQEGKAMQYYYNGCIRAWSFSFSPDSVAHAVRIFRLMEDRSEQNNDGRAQCDIFHKPNTQTYEYILTCLTRAPDLLALATARSIFRKMRDTDVPISTSTINLFIRVLVKSRVPGTLQEAERLLNEVEDQFCKNRDNICPNRTSYEILLQGYSQVPGGIHEAERLLDHMCTLSKKTGVAELYPSPEIYLQMMSIWAKSDQPEAMRRIDQLFSRVASDYKPDSDAYFAYQGALMNTNDAKAPQRVESVLVQMQEDYDTGRNKNSKPTVKNFNVVIHCWASSKQNGAAKRAESILNRMEELYNSNRYAFEQLKPTTSCYESVLLGWSNNCDDPEAAERATALLNRIEAGHLAGIVKPSALCYQHVISTIAGSKDLDKAKKAYSILERMIRVYDRGTLFVRPTSETLIAVIKCCGSVTGSRAKKREAFEFAMAAMENFLDYVPTGLNREAYIQFLHCAFWLLPPGERDEPVKAIFLHKKQSLPIPYIHTALVRNALMQTVSPSVFAEIEQRIVLSG